MKIKTAFFIYLQIFLIVFAIDTMAQDNNKIENSIIDTNIHTVILCKQGTEYSIPIINMNSQDKLVLKFDNLANNSVKYKVSFTHCNANWTLSPLSKMEYQTGFEFDEITNYKTSFNTTQNYFHYEYSFPNENISFIKSGNYIINVLDETDNVVLTSRFYVLETTPINISADAKRANKIEYMNNRQEVDFSIFTNGFYIDNPYQNLQIVLTQNNRQDNAITNLKPKFVKNDEYTYDYEEENTFTADNEYRHLDLRSNKFSDNKIKSINYQLGHYYIEMLPEERRSYKRYFSKEDINGNFIIHRYEATEHQIEADYVNVTFVLKYDAPLIDGEMYVFGSFVDNSFKSANKMFYDYNEKAYKCTMYLKQGYYNYNYAYLPTNKSQGEVWLVEGMQWETENNYNIYVYYRDTFNQYDRLIGFTGFNSIKK